MACVPISNLVEEKLQSVDLADFILVTVVSLLDVVSLVLDDTVALHAGGDSDVGVAKEESDFFEGLISRASQ